MKVDADREAIFGEEAVQINRVSLPKDKARNGIMTGKVLVGYCEIEMPALDGKKHWYPVDKLLGENGERIVEEEIELPADPEDSESDESQDEEE